MAAAEARNAEGNTAFKAGDFIKAKQLYFKAVQADGTVAKYRTNLCNALLKCGDPGMAVEEAAAAVAVDPTWVKGYYFKALALEELGDNTQALAACEEGLHIHRCRPSDSQGHRCCEGCRHDMHGSALGGRGPPPAVWGPLGGGADCCRVLAATQRTHSRAPTRRPPNSPAAAAACRHEPALEAMHSRLLKHKRELQKRQQQQRRQQAAGPAGEQRTVQYCATVRDAAGHEQRFRFEHQVASARLAQAAADKAEATRIIQEVAMPHYSEMLRVGLPWCACWQALVGWLEGGLSETSSMRLGRASEVVAVQSKN